MNMLILTVTSALLAQCKRYDSRLIRGTSHSLVEVNGVIMTNKACVIFGVIHLANVLTGNQILLYMEERE